MKPVDARTATLATLATVLFAVTYPIWAPACPRFYCPTVNEYGDWLAGFVQPIALAWLIWGFWLQREELSLQRQELALTRAELSRQADAAADSAAIAKIAAVMGNRAFVFHSGINWRSHLVPETGRYFWRIRPTWVNSGKTPTRKLTVRIWYALTDAAVVPDIQFADSTEDAIPATIVPGGVIESTPYDLGAEQLDDVKHGRKDFYAWGWARYRDVFPDTPDRTTKFVRKVMSVTGDPYAAWHSEMNPLEIMFGTFGQLNCCDEDCEKR